MRGLLMIAIILGITSIIVFIFMLRFFISNQRNFHTFNRRKMICLMLQHIYFSAMVPFLFAYETAEEAVAWVRNVCAGIVLMATFTELLNLIIQRKKTWVKIVNEPGLDPMDRIYLSMWLEHYSELFTYLSILLAVVLILSCGHHVRQVRIAARRTSFIEENIKVYAFNAAEANDNKNCPICLSDYEAGQELAETNCHHVFHNDCLRGWLNEQNTCPMCREEFF